MWKNRFFWLSLGAIAALVSMILLGLANKLVRFNGSVISPAQPAPQFKLMDPDGQVITPDTFRGKLVLLYFGYTTCPDICPATLADMARIKANLGQKGESVILAFITLDPRRDTPEKLRNYLAVFDPSFIGLTADESELLPVWQAYGIERMLQGDVNSDSYMVDHTSRLFAIDRVGRIRITYPFGFPVDGVISDIRQLLKEKSDA